MDAKLVELILVYLTGPSGAWLVAVSVLLYTLWYGKDMALKFMREVVLRKLRGNPEVRMKAVLKSMVNVNASLTHVARNTEACRVVLLRASNGGGIPRLGNPLYISAVAEYTDPDTNSFLTRWQRRETDPPLIQLLYKLSQNKNVHVSIEELSGSLKDTYDVDKITDTYIVELLTTERSLWFVAVDFKHGAYSDTSVLREVLVLAKSSLVPILKTESAFDS